MPLKHIYWFAYFDISEPSVRYRGKYILEALEKTQHISFTFVYPSYKPANIFHFIVSFLEVLFFRKTNSLLVFQKIYTKGIFSQMLKILLYFRQTNTLYDIDDAEYLRFPPEMMYYFMQKCSSCAVGSHALHEYLQSRNSQVKLLTSPIIPHSYLKKQRNSLFTIGWIGYYNAHRMSLLALFFPALLEIDFPVRLVLLGVVKAEHKQEVLTYFSSQKNIQVEMPENINWLDEASVYQLVMGFDVGVSPLLNTKFNQAKSAFKLKQYLSCGVPALASTVGENTYFLKEGENGFFCDTPQSYKARIIQLKEMKITEYEQFMQNAQKTTMLFSLESVQNLLVSCYENGLN